jgi:beta-fructofuranosidase
MAGIDFTNARPFVNAPVYAGRLVQHPTDGWFLLGFWNEIEGQFAGFISNPIPVSADPELGLIPRIQ